jgi:hypothetical protein
MCISTLPFPIYRQVILTYIYISIPFHACIGRVEAVQKKNRLKVSRVKKKDYIKVPRRLLHIPPPFFKKKCFLEGILFCV